MQLIRAAYVTLLVLYLAGAVPNTVPAKLTLGAPSDFIKRANPTAVRCGTSKR